MARTYRDGDKLRHHSGGLWEVLEHVGGPHDDYRLKCIEEGSGSKLGRFIVCHHEYLPRSFRVESGPDRLRSVVIHQNAETGEELARRELGPEDDYVLVLGPEFHVSYTQRYGNGTTQLTIKRNDGESR